MRRFLKAAAYVLLAVVGITGAFLWWSEDPQGFWKLASAVGGVFVLYWLINDFIVSPLRAEIRQVGERLDRIERRLPPR
jgi:hypothetical protein